MLRTDHTVVPVWDAAASQVVLRPSQKRRAPTTPPLALRPTPFAESSVARLEGWRRKLKAAKIAFWEESHGRRRSLYFEDPNGMILEIAARRWIARA